MKKIFALLLAALLCLSLTACGEKTTDEPQQNEDGDEKVPTLEEILCTSEWYYVGLRTPIGLIFNADGTTGNGGRWTLEGTTLDCVWKNETTTRFELRDVKGAYFMTDEEGITLYNYSTKPDWNTLGLMAVSVVASSWEDHLEVVCVDGEYRLQLKKQYMQALVVGSDYDSHVEITYSQGVRQDVQQKLPFDTGPNGYYIVIENPEETPLEIIGGGGVIYVLTDLM